MVDTGRGSWTCTPEGDVKVLFWKGTAASTAEFFLFAFPRWWLSQQIYSAWGEGVVPPKAVVLVGVLAGVRECLMFGLFRPSRGHLGYWLAYHLHEKRF